MPNHSSISDLAPFVAAVLHDQAVADRHEEWTAAQAELAAAKVRTVAVTGPRGQPVYAAADFPTGNAVDGVWIVSFVGQDDDATGTSTSHAK